MDGIGGEVRDRGRSINIGAHVHILAVGSERVLPHAHIHVGEGYVADSVSALEALPAVASVGRGRLGLGVRLAERPLPRLLRIFLLVPSPDGVFFQRCKLHTLL